MLVVLVALMLISSCGSSGAPPLDTCTTPGCRPDFLVADRSPSVADSIHLEQRDAGRADVSAMVAKIRQQLVGTWLMRHKFMVDRKAIFHFHPDGWVNEDFFYGTITPPSSWCRAYWTHEVQAQSESSFSIILNLSHATSCVTGPSWELKVTSVVSASPLTYKVETPGDGGWDTTLERCASAWDASVACGVTTGLPTPTPSP
jgi:hypothetical protein